MMDTLKAIATNPAMWTALLALANLVLKAVWADYTDTAWLVVSGLIVAVLASLGITGVESISARIRRFRFERTGTNGSAAPTVIR